MTRVLLDAKIPVNATTVLVPRANLVSMAITAISRAVTAFKKRVSNKPETVTKGAWMSGMVYSVCKAVLIQIARRVTSSPARAANANLVTTVSTV